MGANRKGGWDGPAVWPPPPSEEVMTVPRLAKDGMHVEGWCRPPADGVWKPSDLLWLPPSATKSTDIDGVGRIVDVEDYDGMTSHAWVTAQLNKRERYLDMIREKVRGGAYRLTAQLAKYLGIPFDEDAAELIPRRGPLVYGKSADPAYAERLAAAKQARAQFDRLTELINGPAADDRHRYGLCSCHNEYGDPMLPGAA